MILDVAFTLIHRVIVIGAIALALHGCGGGAPAGPSILLTVDSQDNIPAVALLRVTVINNQRVSLPVDVPIDPPADLPPPRSIRLQMPGAGTVRIDAEARSAAGAALARGSVEAAGATATVSLLRLPVPVANDGGALDIAFPNAPTDAASVDCTTSRTSCRAHLQAGCDAPGVYTVGTEEVYCDDGWLLAYANANNWSSTGASDIATTTVPGGYAASRWYDSRWALHSTVSAGRLGKAWSGTGALLPGDVGSINVRAHYDAGLVQVKVEFIRGSDGKTVSGWCDTTGAPWDFSTGAGPTSRCRRSALLGSGDALCLSGGTDQCDGSAWNSGWIGSVTLGSPTWDYAYQSAPNHVNINCEPACVTGNFVAAWDESTHFNNATGGDYMVRIWLREP